MDFPAASYVMSLWHPRRFRQTFASYIGTVLSFFVGKAPLWTREPFTAETAEHLAHRLFGIYDFEKPERRDERLVFDFRDDAFVGLTWRLEVHREFVTVVAFASLQLNTAGGRLGMQALAPTGNPMAFTFDESISLLRTESGSVDSVTDCLFDGRSQPTGLESRMAALFQPLLDSIDRFCETARVGGEPLLPTLWPTYFAKLFGCIVPWTVFAGHDGGPDSRPWFPDLNALGIRSGDAAGLADTARFMDRIWPDLCGDFLNSDRPGTVPDSDPSLHEAGQSCVACYVQHGHGLYISSLGARRDEADRSALHYLVLYRDHSDWHSLRGPTHYRSSHPSLGITGRLSRLAGRLHDTAVSRLAALKQVDRLKNFAQVLSHVENELQRYNPELAGRGGGQSREQLTFEDIQRLRSETFERAERFDESVVNRSLRASSYFENARTLSQDLGVLNIPRWQAYDLFIRRRLFRTLQEVSAVAARYQAVLKVFNTIYQMHTAVETMTLAAGIDLSSKRSQYLIHKLKQLQVGAGVVAGVLLIYYLADVATRLVSVGRGPAFLVNALSPMYLITSAFIVLAILYSFLSALDGRSSNSGAGGLTRSDADEAGRDGSTARLTASGQANLRPVEPHRK